MSGFEPGGQGCYILAPRKSIFAVITNQTLGSVAQGRELAGRQFGFTGRDHGQIHSGQAAPLTYFFKIGRCLIIIRRVGFLAG
jgi:hypothetical protein